MCNSKAIKICSNQHAGLLRILFIEDSLKTKKGLKLVSRPFFIEFFDKNFYLVLLHTLAKSNYQTVFTSQVIQ